MDVTILNKPGLLDWLSGLGVPLLLGGATLAVAVWAGRIAQESNRLNENAQRETREIDARRRRGVFANELGLVVGEILAARMAGTEPKALSDLDNLTAFSRAKAAVDDPSSTNLVSWSSQVARRSPLDRGDFSAWLALTSRVKAMSDLWVQDPDMALAEIEADEEYRTLVGEA